MEHRKQEENKRKQTNINKVEHLYPEGPHSFNCFQLLSALLSPVLNYTDQKPLRCRAGTGGKYTLGQGNRVPSPCWQPVSHVMRQTAYE